MKITIVGSGYVGLVTRAASRKLVTTSSVWIITNRVADADFGRVMLVEMGFDYYESVASP